MEVLKSTFKIQGFVRWEKTKNGVLIAQTDWFENQILAGDSLGASIILDRLASVNTYSLNITHGDIGKGTTPALPSDTQLESAAVRASLGRANRSGLYCDFRFYYPNLVTPNDVYTEFGMLVDGTATMGSGRYLNRIIFPTSMVKGDGEDHTVVCRVTISVT